LFLHQVAGLQQWRRRGGANIISEGDVPPQLATSAQSPGAAKASGLLHDIFDLWISRSSWSAMKL
jgi:hypothetical protein